MFAPFGEIDSCTFKNEGNGVAFVSYKNHENAATALNEMNKTKNA
jgi:RNA recognition motif-containing protein